MSHTVAADPVNAADSIPPFANADSNSDRRAQVGPIAAILLFACLLCLPMFAGRVPVPADTLALWAPWSQLPHEPITNPNLADTTLLYLPSMVFARHAIGDGEWPMWDPYSFGGFPYSANSQNQLYYPLTWLLWLFPLSASLQLLTLFNVLLAGVGMYLFARSQSVTLAGALISGLAFAGSGMLQLALEMPGVASVYGWLPWMLLATYKALRSRSATWSAVAALVCGLTVVAGHLQWVLYSYFVLGCWVLWNAMFLSASSSWQARVSILLRGVVIALGGLALAAIHLTPFLELASLAGRTEGRVSSNSWPLYYLLRMLTPEYFGSATPGPGVPLILNDLWYVGIAALLLAVSAVILRRSRVVWFWLALTLLAVAVTFGIGPFLYVRWLPGLSGLLPMRIGYILIFSIAMLAGLGYDALIPSSTQKRTRQLLAITFSGLLILMILGSAWLALLAEPYQALKGIKEGQVLRALGLVVAAMTLLIVWSILHPGAMIARRRVRYRTSILAATLLVLLLMLDLLTIVPKYNSWVRPDAVLPSTPATEWLRANAGYERIMGVDSPGPVFNPNTQSLFGIYSVAGYDSLHTRRLEKYWATVDPGISGVRLGSPYSNVFIRPQVYTATLASLMNVRFIAAGNSFTPTVALNEVFGGEITLYENTAAIPRAFLVEQAEVLTPTEVLQRLAVADFDPTDAVLIEEEPPFSNEVPASNIDELGSITIKAYNRNSVSLSANMNRPGWLVLSDQNYPGWAVKVDGREEKVYTAYYLFRAVWLGLGRHDVDFSFRPTTLLPSGVISGATVVLVLSLIGLRLLSRVARPRRKPKAAARE